MIEDAELRQIYQASTSERLAKLEESLLHLEKQPNDQAKLEEFLREAHTLKGDSRMLGLDAIEMLIHQLEECFAQIKTGKETITPELCDRAFVGLDAVTQLVTEAITGEEAQVNTFEVLAVLMGAQPEAAAEEVEEDEDDLFAEEISFSEPEVEAKTTLIDAQKTQAIDTIRVEAKKLDALMGDIGELTVTKSRILDEIAEVEEIINLWENWQQNNNKYRHLLQTLASRLPEDELALFEQFWQSTQAHLQTLGDKASQLKAITDDNSSNISLLSNKIQKNLENLRLLPFSTISSAFTRLVRDLAKQQQKQIELVIEGKEVNADKRILEEIKDPLLHIMRNAVDHGIETSAERQKQGKNPTATIRLQAYQTGNTINIAVQDDGRGLNLEKIKQTALQRGIHTPAELAAMSTEQIQALIFASGFSTRSEVSEISGRGVGLDVVKTNVEKLQGNLTVESKAGQGCKFHLQLSTSIATSKVLIVRVNSHPYAIPIEYVDRILLLAKSEIFSLQGNQTIKIAGLPVSVVWLADLLQLPLNVPSTISNAKANAKVLPCLVIKIGKQKLGLLVEEITTQTDIVVKPQNKLLEGISHSNGASILSNGEVCLVLNAQDLITTEQNTGSNNHSVATDKQLSSLLLVEDSIVIRTQMKRILESAGYQVTTAVDGLEGWQKLQAGTFDGVVSDVEMPNLDGLSLTAKIRQYPKYQELPVILITTLAKEADKRRGIEAGANAYLTKGDFDQSLLLETLNRLI